MKLKWPWKRTNIDKIPSSIQNILNNTDNNTNHYQTYDYKDNIGLCMDLSLMFRIHPFKDIRLTNDDIYFVFYYTQTRSFIFQIKVSNDDIDTMNDELYNEILIKIEDLYNRNIESFKDNRLVYR